MSSQKTACLILKLVKRAVQGRKRLDVFMDPYTIQANIFLVLKMHSTESAFV